MAVRPLHPADLPALHQLYVNSIAGTRHGFPPSEDEFSRAFARQPTHLRSGFASVSGRRADPVAFLRTGLYTPVADRWSLAKEGQGLLFGPFYEPGYEADALDLLEDAERALKGRGATSVLAFDPVEAVGAPFHNAGWGGLSEKKSALITLLTDNGYRVEHRELCLTRPEMDLPPAPNPASPFSFSIETRDRNKFAVKLYDGLVYAGVCIYSRLNPARSGDPRAEKIGYIDGLAVTDAYQGKGLGRLLLLQGMKKLRTLGCGPVCLTTGGQNHRAQNLYYSLGFELVDSCITLSKQL